MNTKKLFIILNICVASGLFATVHFIDCAGTSYTIKEKNLIVLMREHVQQNREKIEKKLKKQYVEIKKKMLTNYKPKNLSITIEPAKKDDIYYPDPTYVLDKDIKDANGKIIYPKGFTFNPLHYISLHSQYVFFDYTRKEQVAWIKKNKFDRDITKKLILVNGNVFQARKELGVNIFYASDNLLRRFEIQYSPSLVAQVGDRVEVKTFKLTKKEKTDEKN